MVGRDGDDDSDDKSLEISHCPLYGDLINYNIYDVSGRSCNQGKGKTREDACRIEGEGLRGIHEGGGLRVIHKEEGLQLGRDFNEEEDFN